jgi:hypothetical protein
MTGLQQLKEGAPGTVTLNTAMALADGAWASCVWARKWRVLTDAMIPIDRFRSSERWSLIALDDNDRVLALIPGCRVHAYVFAEKAGNGIPVIA